MFKYEKERKEHARRWNKKKRREFRNNPMFSGVTNKERKQIKDLRNQVAAARRKKGYKKFSGEVSGE